MWRRRAESPNQRVSSLTAALTSGTNLSSSGGRVPTRAASSSMAAQRAGSSARPAGSPPGGSGRCRAVRTSAPRTGTDTMSIARLILMVAKLGWTIIR